MLHMFSYSLITIIIISEATATMEQHRFLCVCRVRLSVCSFHYTAMCERQKAPIWHSEGEFIMKNKTNPTWSCHGNVIKYCLQVQHKCSTHSFNVLKSNFAVCRCGFSIEIDSTFDKTIIDSNCCWFGFCAVEITWNMIQNIQ